MWKRCQIQQRIFGFRIGKIIQDFSTILSDMGHCLVVKTIYWLEKGCFRTQRDACLQFRDNQFCLKSRLSVKNCYNIINIAKTPLSATKSVKWLYGLFLLYRGRFKKRLHNESWNWNVAAFVHNHCTKTP